MRTIIINSQTKDKNGKEHKEDVTHLEFMQKDEERSNSTASKCEGLFKPFAGKLNSLLSSETSKKFETENIYCVNLTSSSTSNASRINKLLKRREEELYKQEDMLILCPIKTATPIRIFQPKKSNFTIVLASQSEFDCSELNPKELNPSRPNYGKLNLCELILTDFKFDTYEKENNGASSDRDIKFKNAKTKSDSVILYKENDDGKDDKNKTKGACFTSIRQSSDEIEYKLEDGVVKMSHFKLPSSKDEYLNFNLLNFAKENNFTLRDDKDSAMFDMKLRLALGNNVEPTSTSSSSLALTLNNLIIEDEKGEASDIDKIYLHHCGDKSIYESSSLVKNKESDMKNSYTATFNIPIDRNDKKDTKLIVYSSDLSKIHDTKGIHAYTGTAIISIGYKDKSGASFSYTNKVSLRDITDHIVNVVSDSQYPFKTNEEISLKAIYKQEKGSKRYKEVLWGYKVIKTIEYNEVSKSNPKDVVALKDQKGKEIRFKISDLIKKDDLDKIKQGGHTIVFFAYLEGEKDKFKYQSVYGKNHIRIDIKIPLYIKFKDDKLIIYEFEHAIKEKSFKASLNHDDALVNKSGYLYINKDMSAQDINIYEDDKLTKELKSEDSTNKRYQIYIVEANSANNQNPSNTNQTGQTKINQDTKYGINLLSKDNMNSFINSFNESKSITRVDKGMWVDRDEEVGVKTEIDIRIFRIRAFMCAIKYGEGTNGSNGYEINVGGKLFTKDYGKDFSDHPRYYVKSLNSSAAGAYQIKSSTWDMILKKYKKTYDITDFSPINQDKACLILIKHIRNALELIADEKIDEAVRSRTDNDKKRLHYEWASMPDSPYGQRTITMDKFMEYYMYHLELEQIGISNLAISNKDIKKFLD
ncbi:glycoside hydrolase family 104 protein [Campylobacter concisus]|uniref:glycoside hydrolase family 24 protein n=1 Tax=Campylobacter concisus TaxID=199 RepID=UPI00131CC950|nr:glycoside hydrolase family 104 protein [Campylobacter concisus]